MALLVVLAALLTGVIKEEGASSRRQANWFSSQMRDLTFEVHPGPSPSIHFPGSGPFDLRLGYHALPTLVDRLLSQRYEITAQARMSPEMITLAEQGFNPPYREKSQAGLEVRDCRKDPFYSARYPRRVYARFDEVPRLIVASLLFIENRELLSASPMHNPAIEWDRLGRSMVDQLLHRIDSAHAAGGGSTLATQIEKYRHSPEGRTGGFADKVRQIYSASLRAYLDGPMTLTRRREIVVEYLNTVPLAARAGIGEVHGLGDAMWAWFGREFDEVNELLSGVDDESGPHHAEGEAHWQPLALAFKQALSLLVAQRRPAHYLSTAGAPALGELTNSHLRLLADAGVIPAALRDTALPLKLQLRPRAPLLPARAFVKQKADSALRSHLQMLLAMPRAYDLDRLDLAADSALSGELQDAATRRLRSLQSPGGAQAAGMYGKSLLRPGDDASKISFSFTLFESAGGVNLLRAQTDSVDQPFDLNEGGRLDLGSTAKLRTLVTYLQQVEALHRQWSELDDLQLRQLQIGRRDAIARWARQHLQNSKDRGLTTMLEAAMQRTYSASPSEGFFTGGGLHRFENFDASDNGRSMSVAEAFKRSVNLVFIRMMRDIVHRVLAADLETDSELLDDPADPRREQYLARFADKEGRQFVARFYAQFAGRAPREVEELLLRQVKRTPTGLASTFYSLQPEADVSQLWEFLGRHMPTAQNSAQALHDQRQAGRWSLSDRGYLAGVHPLQLWLAGYLRQHPQATLEQAFVDSRAQRQEVYGWLFKTRRKAAQDQRIRTLLEIDAFEAILRDWKRLGYPFDSITPSYATALGASGDRPTALAELMGIVVNGGLRLPTARFESLRFAEGTPYDTELRYAPAAGKRVLAAEVAAAARRALILVVEEGTGKRLKGALDRQDGTPAVIGAKTGTGDHRFDVHGPSGRLVSSRVINRSATIVFMIGDRYFGTIMAYVNQPHAAHYKFTSALPSQLLKTMTPDLLLLIQGSPCGHAAAAE